ncbi:hypothetical protein GALMADRAFT_143986 [Galerina marginata CBS 339.88]|uniref:SCP domain-containing protein n=1 Tax=Galerina marginata (strain CBS 339.88) TaxID=685588 RepID=A0A067SU97_GALM3|nr:hypothetical protein GALMADRAFT_143986 [Galerina marginata CBS 339.88]
MRAFSLIAFATIVLGGASALTVPAKQVATNNVEQLEAREPKNPIKFSKGSKSHMDRLGLHKNSLDRQQVKDYHRQVVGQEMNHNGASSAQVVHLAHSVGSVDPKFHVTAGFWDANDKRIKSSYGNPPKKGNLHHVYADHVDPTYAHYVHQAGGHLRQSLKAANPGIRQMADITEAVRWMTWKTSRSASPEIATSSSQALSGSQIPRIPRRPDVPDTIKSAA